MSCRLRVKLARPTPQPGGGVCLTVVAAAASADTAATADQYYVVTLSLIIFLCALFKKSLNRILVFKVSILRNEIIWKGNIVINLEITFKPFFTSRVNGPAH